MPIKMRCEGRPHCWRERWEGPLAVRKHTQTKVHGPKKKIIASFLTLELTVKAAGALSPKPPAFSVAARAVVSAGSTISALTSSAAISPSKKTNSSSNSTASLATSKHISLYNYSSYSYLSHPPIPQS